MSEKYLDKKGLEYLIAELNKKYTTQEDIDEAIAAIPAAAFSDIAGDLKGMVNTSWDKLPAGYYSGTSSYNGQRLAPVMNVGTVSWWNSASGQPIDVNFHFEQEHAVHGIRYRLAAYTGTNKVQVFCVINGELVAVSEQVAATANGITYEINVNPDDLSSAQWTIRFTCSGWMDLRLATIVNEFTPGLYSTEFHNLIIEKFHGYQPIGNYALRSEIPTKLSQLQNDIGAGGGSNVTKVSELENDAGFITAQDLPQPPQKLSELENDAGFITANDIPEVPTNDQINSLIEAYMQSHYENGNEGEY